MCANCRLHPDCKMTLEVWALHQYPHYHSRFQVKDLHSSKRRVDYRSVPNVLPDAGPLPRGKQGVSLLSAKSSTFSGFYCYILSIQAVQC